jgi:hypothetical protein
MPNLPPLPLIDGAFFIDNSTLEALTTCPRAFEYSKLHRRINAAEAPALNFGSAIHLALELRYKTCGSDPTDPLYDQAMMSVLHDHFELTPNPDDDFRNLNWAIEVIRRYNNKYLKEEFDVLRYHTPIACSHCNGSGEIKESIDCYFCNGTGESTAMVELPFAAKLFDCGSTPVYYTGRIDLPNQRPEGLFINDHKTTSLLGSGFFDQLKMSAQQKGYCWAFENLTGQPVRGYEVNAIRIKEPPMYVTKGTTTRGGKSQSPEQWWDESLQRERFLLNPGELSEWKQNVICQIEEFFWHHSRDFFPKKTTWCVGKYGRCSYFDVCSLYPVEDRGAYLSSGLFKDNNWSPLISPTQSRQQT